MVSLSVPLRFEAAHVSLSQPGACSLSFLKKRSRSALPAGIRSITAFGV